MFWTRASQIIKTYNYLPSMICSSSTTLTKNFPQSGPFCSWLNNPLNFFAGIPRISWTLPLFSYFFYILSPSVEKGSDNAWLHFFKLFLPENPIFLVTLGLSFCPLVHPQGLSECKRFSEYLCLASVKFFFALRGSNLLICSAFGEVFTCS